MKRAQAKRNSQYSATSFGDRCLLGCR